MKLIKMKELHIIRHAKSSWNIQGLPDEFRPLNEQGYYDAPHMAKWFSNQNKKGVDLLISSPAIRAYSTCSFFASSLNYRKHGIVIEPNLLHATPNDIQSVLFSIPDEANSVCIFGHNPGFTWFANSFLSDPLDNLPTCGVVSLKSSAEFWRDFLPGKIIEQQFMSPKKLHR